MLKNLLPLCAVLFLLGCLSSCSESKQSEKSQADNFFELHATTGRNQPAEVIAFSKMDSLYHLIYAQESNEWNHLVTKNLRRWEAGYPQTIDARTKAALAIDLQGNKGLPQMWLQLENKQGKINRYESNDGINWSGFSGNPVLDASDGELRLSWNPVEKAWILCIATTTGEIEIWETNDFESWKPLGRLSSALSFRKAGIFYLKNQPVLQLEGEALVWQKMIRTNEGFQFDGDTTLATFYGHPSATIYRDGNEDLLFSSHAAAGEENVSTFGLPLAVSLENDEIRFSQTTTLQSTLISKRRGLINRLIGAGATQYTVNIKNLSSDLRADLIADSSRIASLFIDRFESSITLDRSLAPMGDQQMVTYATSPLDSSFQVDIILDSNTIDVMINNGKSFLGTFHLGNSNPANRIKLFVDNEEKELPGTILVFDKAAMKE